MEEFEDMKEGKTALTRTLLDKDASERSPEENRLVAEYLEERERRYDSLEKANEEISRDCSMLCEREKSPIPDYGWMWPVKELCYRLEGLNYDYGKYGIRVTLEQSKEKYGTLRFYTYTHVKETGLVGFLVKPFDFAANLLSRLDFRLRRVIDRDEYKSVEWREITKEQFDARSNEYGRPFSAFNLEPVVVEKSNVTDTSEMRRKAFLAEEDGKYFYAYELTHLSKSHLVPTRHRILYRIRNALSSASLWIGRFYREGKPQRVKSEEFDYRVDELIRDAEEKCTKVCQHCGDDFNEFTKRCETQGWYMYVCERCAMASGMRYRIGDSIYLEGEKIEPEKDDKE